MRCDQKYHATGVLSNFKYETIFHLVIHRWLSTFSAALYSFLLIHSYYSVAYLVAGVFIWFSGHTSPLRYQIGAAICLAKMTTKNERDWGEVKKVGGGRGRLGLERFYAKLHDFVQTRTHTTSHRIRWFPFDRMFPLYTMFQHRKCLVCFSFNIFNVDLNWLEWQMNFISSHTMNRRYKNN